MAAAWAQWEHVTKIDPDKPLHDEDSYVDIADTGTDAIIIGGTTNVTEARVQPILNALSSTEIPIFVEPTYRPSSSHTEALSGYLLPIVLNADDPLWITGAHHEWVRSSDLEWDYVHPEAYIVLNPASSVATYTQADCDLDVDDVVAYTTLAEQILGQQIVYLEYSGTLGDPAVVAAVRDALSSAQPFYGGGIHDYDSAYEMAKVADTVVVGDVLHDAGIEAVEATVRGTTDAKHES
ncbi:phosphoglycerol geranylgeranyltransferase [Haladaptatus litoreus]|uniref:Geranylgeranylglyceryl phosphate synthase n=1 Tax=Haladaptatus litoreus TaxID=553468 RepID=A0A1N7FDC5_9EURY|nr:putative phosphoglycerol geranylgeranyltransferase [Haladaptatus litoreus]SIR98339.1 phosphoglycerol geranylgeranyltransferase [Haladaptatus litoreus]